nr:MAG TPA: RNA 2'-phosphotransferase, Tpt1 / KptA family [Caudoviricetes sp.]
MKLYHATPARNLGKIMTEGLKKRRSAIYFADSSKAAAGFVLIRGEKEVVVFEVDIDDSLIEESFDHNETIMKRLLQIDSCKCFTYSRNIKAADIDFKKCQIWEID